MTRVFWAAMVWLISAPVWADEALVLRLPDGFELVQEIAAGGIDIRDYMPEGQTGDNWDELLSVQHFAGLEPFDPHRFLTGLSLGGGAACTGNSVEMTTHNAHPVAVTVLSCQGVNPETFVTGVLSGEAGLYVVQAAWRGELQDASLQRWIDVILGAEFCASHTEPGCDAG